VVAQEKLLVEECLELLQTVSALQVESWRYHYDPSKCDIQVLKNFMVNLSFIESWLEVLDTNFFGSCPQIQEKSLKCYIIQFNSKQQQPQQQEQQSQLQETPS
jgi:hypothetical protein